MVPGRQLAAGVPAYRASTPLHHGRLLVVTLFTLNAGCTWQLTPGIDKRGAGLPLRRCDLRFEMEELG